MKSYVRCVNSKDAPDHFIESFRDVSEKYDQFIIPIMTEYNPQVVLAAMTHCYTSLVTSLVEYSFESEQDRANFLRGILQGIAIDLIDKTGIKFGDKKYDEV